MKVVIISEVLRSTGHDGAKIQQKHVIPTTSDLVWPKVYKRVLTTSLLPEISKDQDYIYMRYTQLHVLSPKSKSVHIQLSISRRSLRLVVETQGKLHPPS